MTAPVSATGGESAAVAKQVYADLIAKRREVAEHVLMQLAQYEKVRGEVEAMRKRVAALSPGVAPPAPPITKADWEAQAAALVALLPTADAFGAPQLLATFPHAAELAGAINNLTARAIVAGVRRVLTHRAHHAVVAATATCVAASALHEAVDAEVGRLIANLFEAASALHTGKAVDVDAKVGLPPPPAPPEAGRFLRIPYARALEDTVPWRAAFLDDDAVAVWRRVALPRLQSIVNERELGMDLVHKWAADATLRTDGLARVAGTIALLAAWCEVEGADRRLMILPPAAGRRGVYCGPRVTFVGGAHDFSGWLPITILDDDSPHDEHDLARPGGVPLRRLAVVDAPSLVRSSSSVVASDGGGGSTRVAEDAAGTGVDLPVHTLPAPVVGDVTVLYPTLSAAAPVPSHRVTLGPCGAEPVDAAGARVDPAPCSLPPTTVVRTRSGWNAWVCDIFHRPQHPLSTTAPSSGGVAGRGGHDSATAGRRLC